MELDELGSSHGREPPDLQGGLFLSESGEGALDDVLDDVLDDISEDAHVDDSENSNVQQEQQVHRDSASPVYDVQSLAGGLETQRTVSMGQPAWTCAEEPIQKEACRVSDTPTPARKGSRESAMSSKGVPASGARAIRASWGTVGNNRTAAAQQLCSLQQRPATAGSRAHPDLHFQPEILFRLPQLKFALPPGTQRTAVDRMLLCSRMGDSQ